MDTEFEKEKIGLLKTEMNLLWSAVFITFGGSLAICLNASPGWRWIFSIIGFSLSLIFMNAFAIKRNEAVKLINSMKGKN